LLLYSSYLPLRVPNWPVIYFINPVASWRRSESLCGKNAEPPLLLGQRVYVGGRRGRGDGRGDLTIGGRGQAWVAPPGGEPRPLPPFVSPSGSVGLLAK
jgi:hypothetical protein